MNILVIVIIIFALISLYPSFKKGFEDIIIDIVILISIILIKPIVWIVKKILK